jgi:predicted membrane-bound mannosyltransferase
MVFYSRYLIHEMLLVVFTALFVGSGWRWGQTGKLTWAMASGAGLGLMYATKETFVFPLCAVTIANAAVAVWRRCVRPSLGRPVDASQCGTLNPKSEIGQGLFVSAATNRWWGLALLATTAGVIGFVLFTSFFTNRGGPLDSILTYQPWLHRAQGASPHIYPWSFYLERLAWFHWPKGQVWSEGAILVLALVGAVAAIVGRGITSRGVWPVRWLTVYTFVLTAIYSVVAYKTPWCLLGFLHGMILLAGVGAVALWNWMQSPAARAGLAIALGAAGLQLTWQSWQASFVFFASRQNPYVYAQTTPDILALVQRAEAIAAVHPAGRSTIVKVIAPDGDYGPLPYYLRRLGHVLWSDAMPNDPYAPVMIVSARFGAELDEKSGKRYLMARLYELRPGTFFELYVELELWKKYLATLPPPPE